MALQDHLHLALTLSGSPEFAPVHSWKASGYQELPEIILAQKRTSLGKLRFHTIHNSMGTVKFMNFQLTLKCLTDNSYTGREYLAFLEAMNGESVFFVDFDHADDGSDHTPYVLTMKMQINRVRPMTTILNYYMVDLELFDDHTVT